MPVPLAPLALQGRCAPASRGASRTGRFVVLLATAPIVSAGCTVPNPSYHPATTEDGSRAGEARPPTDSASDLATDRLVVRVPIDCFPATTRLDRQACATGSIVLHNIRSTPSCDLRPGEPRSPNPVLTFIRQDEACAGDRTREVTYFARANESWRLLETSEGRIDPDGRGLRELPVGRSIAIKLRTESSPPLTYDLSVILGEEEISLVKLEELR